jgi:hypothetical protein
MTDPAIGYKDLNDTINTMRNKGNGGEFELINTDDWTRPVRGNSRSMACSAACREQEHGLATTACGARGP